MLLSNGFQRRVVRLLVAHEWAVCFDRDAMLVAIVDNLLLLAPRMKLVVKLAEVRHYAQEGGIPPVG